MFNGQGPARQEPVVRDRRVRPPIAPASLLCVEAELIVWQAAGGTERCNRLQHHKGPPTAWHLLNIPASAGRRERRLLSSNPNLSAIKDGKVKTLERRV